MKTRLVIAGGSGFLGGGLVEHFTARGWEVILGSAQEQAKRTD